MVNGHVEDAGERLGQQRLADAGGPDEQDVGLVQLDVAVAARLRVDALVVVVHGNGQGALGAFLADDVLIEDVLDLLRQRYLGNAVGNLALLILRQDLVAEGDALVADIDRRAGNELPDRVL